MNKTKLVKQLDSLAENVARKGIFVVSKEDGNFVVKEHISDTVVAKDIPIRSVAEYICRLKNKGKTPPITVLHNIRKLISQFFKYQNDIFFYRNTLKSTADSCKYDATEARMIETQARLSHTHKELQRYR